jgi:uncharacterized membrane protein YdfJ with MMPL/SSD domain
MTTRLSILAARRPSAILVASLAGVLLGAILARGPFPALAQHDAQ